MKTATIIKTNTTELKFPYNQEIIDRIKKMQGRRYDAKNKSWSVILDFQNCFETENIIKDYNFSACPKTLEIISKFKKEAEELVSGKPSEVKLLEPPAHMVKALADMGFSYRPYQIEGFSLMVQWGRSLNGCEMGLGKTLQAITAVEYKQALPCLVVCPASLKYNWAQEIAKFVPGRKVLILDGKEIIYPGYDYYVINYDNMDSRKKDLLKMNLSSAILDECHYIKNKKAKRSKATSEVVKRLPIRHLLSGTIIENRPAELLHPFELLDRLDELGGYWKFIHRYCDAKSNGFGFDIGGANNIEELHLRMSRSFYFRRNKADVLKELPDKVYSTIEVDIDNMKEYLSAEKDLVSFLQNDILEKEETKKTLKGLSKEEKLEYLSNKMDETEDKVNGAEHLVLMSTLRKISARGKIKPLKDWVGDFLESSSEKVLIFAWHTEVVLEMAKEFGWKAIYGGTPAKTRQDYVNEFQNDPNVRGLVLNIKAGGVGLNLTKSSTVLFVEEPLNPALKLQAEDRAHRIGQKDTVNVFTFLARQTIDIDINTIVSEKLRVVNSVNAGKFAEDSGVSVMKEILQKLMNK